MNNTAKIWLIVAGVLVVLGTILVVGAAAASGFSFSGFGSEPYETQTIEIGSTFDRIAVDTDITDVTIATADEAACRVEYTAPKQLQHSADVADSTLVIKSADTRKWYERIFSFTFKSPQLTVYLPQAEYTSLQISSYTGDILIPEGFTFGTLAVDGDTSDVACAADVMDAVAIKLSTGDVTLSCPTAGSIDIVTATGSAELLSVAAQDAVSVTTDTGDIKLQALTCTDFTAETATGDITLDEAIASGSFRIESDTGSVRFSAADAEEIHVKTDTGDVTGTLRSDKLFFTETSTGDVSVPKTLSGGRCEISTVTGDIRIEIDYTLKKFVK